MCQSLLSIGFLSFYLQYVNEVISRVGVAQNLLISSNFTKARNKHNDLDLTNKKYNFYFLFRPYHHKTADVNSNKKKTDKQLKHK
jgi:hypothetical protein